MLPQVVFATQLDTAWEMVSLLVAIEVLDVLRQDVARPLEVEHFSRVSSAIKQLEPSALAAIDDSVVDVCTVGNSE